MIYCRGQTVNPGNKYDYILKRYEISHTTWSINRRNSPIFALILVKQMHMQ